MIENLPLLRPDVSRSARTMSRCHARLAVRRRQVESRTRSESPKAPAAERVFAATVCVAYLIAMVGNLLQIMAP